MTVVPHPMIARRRWTQHEVDSMLVTLHRCQRIMMKQSAQYHDLDNLIRLQNVLFDLLTPVRATGVEADPDLGHLTPLTPREVEVLGLFPTSTTNVEIAERLHITETTVKHHISSIYQKLRVRTRDEAIARGFRLGLIGGAPAER